MIRSELQFLDLVHFAWWFEPGCGSLAGVLSSPPWSGGDGARRALGSLGVLKDRRRAR